MARLHPDLRSRKGTPLGANLPHREGAKSIAGVLQSALKMALVAGFVLWVLLRWLERASLYHPNPMSGPDPGAYGLDFEEVYLGEGRERLRAWFLPGRGPVTVLYSGGNGESAAAIIASDAWRRTVVDLGVSVLVWDYPGYGASGGRPEEATLGRGARASLAYLRSRPDVDPARIVLWGHSLGTFVTVDLAASEKVAGVVLQAPVSSTLEVARDVLGPLWHVARMLPGVPRQRLDVLTRLPLVQAQVLVLHGTDDEVLNVRHGRLVAQAADVELIEVHGARHMSPWGREESAIREAYRLPIAAFLSRVAVEGNR